MTNGRTVILAAVVTFSHRLRLAADHPQYLRPTPPLGRSPFQKAPHSGEYAKPGLMFGCCGRLVVTPRITIARGEVVNRIDAELAPKSLDAADPDASRLLVP